MRSSVLRPDDDRYPPRLADLTDVQRGKPFPTLYVRGSLPSAPGVALVGKRSSTPDGERFARELASSLARAGVPVWSGGALGIDTAAHEGALDAGGITVAVLGVSLDRLYPKSNEPLFERALATGGALISRLPDGCPSFRGNFLLRNELLAALTAATIVIEAGIVSGARSTAAAARRLGRVVGAVPRAPWDPAGAGCAAELLLGARPVTSARDALELLGRAVDSGGSGSPVEPALLDVDAAHARAPSTDRPAYDPKRTPDEEAIVAFLANTPLHIDDLCARSGLPFPVVAEALLTLTLHSVVVEGPAGFYRRAVPCSR